MTDCASTSPMPRAGCRRPRGDRARSAPVRARPRQYASAMVDGEPLPVGMPVEPLFGGEGDRGRRALAATRWTSRRSISLHAGSGGGVRRLRCRALRRAVRDRPRRRRASWRRPSTRPSFDGPAQISGAFDVPEVSSARRHPRRAGSCPSAQRSSTVCPATGELPDRDFRPCAVTRAAERGATPKTRHPAASRGRFCYSPARCAGPFPS